MVNAEGGRSLLQPSRAAFLRAWLRDASSEHIVCSWALGAGSLAEKGFGSHSMWRGEVLHGTSRTWEPMSVVVHCGFFPASSPLSVVDPTQK